MPPLFLMTILMLMIIMIKEKYRANLVAGLFSKSYPAQTKKFLTVIAGVHHQYSGHSCFGEATYDGDRGYQKKDSVFVTPTRSPGSLCKKLIVKNPLS